MAARFVRKVRTASGAVGLQIVTRQGRVVVDIDHVGSAHDDAELELLMQVARSRLLPGQGVLDLGEIERVPVSVEDVADWTQHRGELPLDAKTVRGRPRVVAGGGQVVATSAPVLWDVLVRAYTRLGFDALGDEAFRSMVLARIIEPEGVRSFV